MPDNPVQWLCPGIVHKQGKTLVVGISKVGKTILSTDLAVGLATGESFICFPCEKVRVLYIVLERFRDFQAKLRRIVAGRDISNLKVLDYSKKPLILDDPKDTKGYDTLCQAVDLSNPDVIVLDSKYRTTSKKESDEESSKVWIDRIDSVIESRKTGFVVIHHSPKMEYEELVHRTAGSSFLARWADVFVGMSRKTRDRKDRRRTLEFVSNYGDEPDPIDVEITGLGLIDAAPKLKINEAYTALENELKKGMPEGITRLIKQLAEQTGISEPTFWTVWRTLRIV